MQRLLHAVSEWLIGGDLSAPRFGADIVSYAADYIWECWWLIASNRPPRQLSDLAKRDKIVIRPVVFEHLFAERAAVEIRRCCQKDDCHEEAGCRGGEGQLLYRLISRSCVLNRFDQSKRRSTGGKLV